MPPNLTSLRFAGREFVELGKSVGNGSYWKSERRNQQVIFEGISSKGKLNYKVVRGTHWTADVFRFGFEGAIGAAAGALVFGSIGAAVGAWKREEGESAKTAALRGMRTPAKWGAFLGFLTGAVAIPAKWAKPSDALLEKFPDAKAALYIPKGLTFADAPDRNNLMKQYVASRVATASEAVALYAGGRHLWNKVKILFLKGKGEKDREKRKENKRSQAHLLGVFAYVNSRIPGKLFERLKDLAPGIAAMPAWRPVAVSIVRVGTSLGQPFDFLGRHARNLLGPAFQAARRLFGFGA